MEGRYYDEKYLWEQGGNEVYVLISGFRLRLTLTPINQFTIRKNSFIRNNRFRFFHPFIGYAQTSDLDALTWIRFLPPFIDEKTREREIDMFLTTQVALVLFTPLGDFMLECSELHKSARY